MNVAAHECVITSAEAMEAVGAALARGLRAGLIIYLRGELGAGKTTLVRGLLHALGHSGTVKSPTYTLVEPYALAGRDIYHFDLYRLTHPAELEAMGVRDYFRPDAVCLIEWPERASGLLPAADIEVVLQHAGAGRSVMLASHSAAGAAGLARFATATQADER